MNEKEKLVNQIEEEVSKNWNELSKEEEIALSVENAHREGFLQGIRFITMDLLIHARNTGNFTQLATQIEFAHLAVHKIKTGEFKCLAVTALKMPSADIHIARIDELVEAIFGRTKPAPVEKSAEAAAPLDVQSN
jgi:hypothetical protein